MPQPALFSNDLLRARLLLLLGLGLLFLLHWPALIDGSGFTSDSLGLIRHCATLSEQGQLWTWMLQGFTQGLGVASNYYRPLAAAALCLDYPLYGVNPVGWHLNQLALHAMNGLLLYRLARSLAGNERLAASVAALAAIVFWLSPATPEVSLWIAGRYNALATLFMLLSLLALVHSRPFWSALALALALCSKESAMVMPALLASVSWWRYAIEGGARPSFVQRCRASLSELWPSALIFTAYLAWRWYLFGDPLSVYPHSQQASGGLLEGFGWAWLERFELLGTTLLPAWRDAGVLTVLFWLANALALGFSAWRAWRSGRWLALWGLPMLWLAVAVFALLPHLKELSAAGQGSRLLYAASGWYALALCLPWAGHSWHQQRRWPSALAALAVLVLLQQAQAPAQRDWSEALHYTRKLTQQLAAIAAEQAQAWPAGHWSLVLIPDHRGVALVGRNAQGALVVPPYQQQVLLGQLVPLVPQDLPDWHQRLHQGQAQGLPWPPPIQGEQQQRWPSAFYCADPVDARLHPLPALERLNPRSSAAEWQQSWQHALAGGPCAAYAEARPAD